MSNALPTATRTLLENGKYRYGVIVDGHTVNLVMESKVLYTHASVYKTSHGVTIAHHKTEAAAARGNSDLNRYCTRIGHVALTDI
jgi:hypothetical protein